MFRPQPGKFEHRSVSPESLTTASMSSPKTAVHDALADRGIVLRSAPLATGRDRVKTGGTCTRCYWTLESGCVKTGVWFSELVMRSKDEEGGEKDAPLATIYTGDWLDLGQGEGFGPYRWMCFESVSAEATSPLSLSRFSVYILIFEALRFVFKWIYGYAFKRPYVGMVMVTS